MKTKHYLILLAGLGALGIMISGLADWREALTPQFVGGAILQVVAHVVAMLTDKPAPAPPSTLRRGTGALSILLVAALALPGCALWAGVAPNATVTEQQAKLQQLARIADGSRQMLVIAQGVQAVEIAAHDTGRIADDTHRRVQQAFLDFGQAADTALANLQDFAAPEADRYVAARALTRMAGELATRLDGAFGDQVPPELRAMFGSFRAALVALGLATGVAP
ncbi:MAG: hypothetical protein AB7H88_22400 [Vicinamibacterales bacterium]